MKIDLCNIFLIFNFFISILFFSFKRLSKFNFGEKILKMINKNKILKTKENKVFKFGNLNKNENNEDNTNMDIEESENEVIDFNYNFNNFSNKENDIQKPFEIIEGKNNEDNANYRKANYGENTNVNYFSTSEGTIGVIIRLTKEVFEYLHYIQKEIIKNEIGPLKQDYEKWRSVKVNIFYEFYYL